MSLNAPFKNLHSAISCLFPKLVAMENIYLCCYASHPLITFKNALITAVLMSMETPPPLHIMHVLTSPIEAFRSNFMNNVPFVIYLWKVIKNRRCKCGYLLYPFIQRVCMCMFIRARRMYLCSRLRLSQWLFKGIEWCPLWPPLPPFSVYLLLS